METITQPEHTCPAPETECTPSEEKEENTCVLGETKPLDTKQSALSPTVQGSLDCDSSAGEYSKADVVDDLANSSPQDSLIPKNSGNDEYELSTTTTKQEIWGNSANEGSGLSTRKQEIWEMQCAQPAPQEKVRFAVILAERIADLLDVHQSYAARNNSKALLRNSQLKWHFNELFLAAIEASQEFQIVLTRNEAFDFLHSIKFHLNYRMHIKCRTYFSTWGSTIAAATVPSTPGIGGWIYFVVGNERIRKSDGYGDHTVDEVLRRGTKAVTHFQRIRSEKVTRSTSGKARSLRLNYGREEKRAIEGVIRRFKELDDPVRPAWVQQANQTLRQMIAFGHPLADTEVNPYFQANRTPVQYGHPGTSTFTHAACRASQTMGPGFQQAVPEYLYGPQSARQQHGFVPPQFPAGFTHSYPSNAPFARQLEGFGNVSRSTYTRPENEREWSKYYGPGRCTHPFGSQQPGIGGQFGTVRENARPVQGIFPQQHRRHHYDSEADSEAETVIESRPGPVAGLSESSQESSQGENKEIKPPKKAGKSEEERSMRKTETRRAASMPDLALEEKAAFDREWPKLPADH